MNALRRLFLLAVAALSMPVSAADVEEVPIGEAVERHLSGDQPFSQWVQDPERVEAKNGRYTGDTRSAG